MTIQHKNPTTEYIQKLLLDVINNIPANDNRPVEWHFACELLKQNNVFTHYCDDNIRAKTKPLTDDEIIQTACNYFYGLINKDERDNFVRFARAIENAHGIE